MNSLTKLLERFVTTFSGGYTNLLPSINSLLGVLIAIELALLGLWWAVSGQDQILTVLKKVFFIGFWIWFVRSFPSLVDAFVGSLVTAGFTAAGSTGGLNVLMDPSRFFEYALQATTPIAQAIAEANVFNVGTAFVLGAAYIILIVAYFIIAIQVFLTVLEYYLVMAVAGILLPWGILAQTKFLAEKAIGAVVSAGIKLMVLSFLIAVAEPVLSATTFMKSDDFAGIIKASWETILTVGAIAFLAWNAPGMAAGLMSGSPSLTAGGAIQNVMSGAMLGAGLATAGSTAALRAAAGGMAAIGHAAGVVSSGARMGSALATGSVGADGETVPASRAARAMAAIGGGIKAAGASLVQSTAGRGIGALRGSISQGFQEGAAQGWDAMQNPLQPPAPSRQEQGNARRPAWTQQAAQALRRLPTEARPSGGGGVRI